MGHLTDNEARLVKEAVARRRTPKTLSEKFREFAIKEGGKAVGSTAAEFGELIRTEYKAFASIVKDLGLGKQ